MKKIKKAVILAAGLGTRFLPITKTFPKEMLPIVDKPVLQYIIEEIVESGIKDIILVISKEKEIIKNYFQANKKLEYFLKKRGKLDLLKEVKKTNKLANFTYLYQRKPLGIGDAILVAKEKIKNEPFGLFFADDVIVSQKPCLAQMMMVYKNYPGTIFMVARVPKKEVFHYGIAKVKKIKKRIYQVLDVIEKPKEEVFSNFAIVGRYILEPEIFKILTKIKPQKNQEIYLTDAIKILLKERKPVYAYQAKGQWLSCGNKIGWLKANIKIGLQHQEIKKELKQYLK
ncbi:MAG: UTP--glucose-1-phosphate uridylyltransferase [Patescibacteria group bacterium]